MSIRSLPSIRKVYRLVSAVSQVYQRVTQGSPKKILQSTKLVRVYCGSIPINLRDLRSILNDPPKSTKCILNLRDIPNSLRSLQSIPNLSEYTKTIRKVYYSIRFHGIFDSYIIFFQPPTVPLPDLWHAHRPNIILPEKFQTLFPCSHLFAFLNFLTGPGDRNFTEQQMAVAMTQWVTRALERKSSVIFSLCIYSVSKCGTSCVLFYKIVLHLLITIIPIEPFTLLKHQHPTLIRISSTILRIHIIHTILHTYKAKNVLLKHF